MPTQLGAAVNFGFAGTDGIASSLLTGKMFLQSSDYSKSADEEQVRDGEGALVNRTFYNPGEKASLEYVPKGSTKANAISNTTIPDVGTLVVITACENLPALVKTNWVVVGEPKITKGSNNAAKITLALEAHAGITAAAS
jgi:hypothetical protein